MIPKRDLSLGVDVGGTNTDAVILDGSGSVVASTKQPTTADLSDGIRASIAHVLGEIGDRRSRVSRVMLGTTHATNAIVARRNLAKVAVIRLGAPAATQWPPLMAWPEDLASSVLAGSAMLPGGHMIDGTPISPLNHDGIRRFLDSLTHGFDAIVLCGIFSPAFPQQELEVASLVREHVGPGVRLFLSQDIGPTGLIERENATILNAALHQVAYDVTAALVQVVRDEALDAETYFAQNDGTLMSLEYAEQFPVLTIGSGPANSLRGAAYLSGTDNAIVIDVGGTTSDLGVLSNGFPRESTMPREIGGVQTNFRMPDILSIGIGGGTVVDVNSGRVGPVSVGFRINTEALIFGGSTPTLTDAAVLGGATIPGRALPELSKAVTSALNGSREVMASRLEEAVQHLSLGRMDLPLVVVGGGGFLVPDSLPGVREVIRPAFSGVANAVGAAISLAGGRANQIADLEDREAAIEAASKAAIAKAIQSGADPLQVEIIDILETSVSYSARPTVNISVKAAGPLSFLRSTIPTAV